MALRSVEDKVFQCCVNLHKNSSFVISSGLTSEPMTTPLPKENSGLGIYLNFLVAKPKVPVEGNFTEFLVSLAVSAKKSFPSRKKFNRHPLHPLQVLGASRDPIQQEHLFRRSFRCWCCDSFPNFAALEA